MRFIQHSTLWVATGSAIVAVAIAALPTGAAGQLASRPADEWVEVLDRPERLAALEVDQVVAALKLRPGDVVADLGAGAGAFSVPFARAVSAGGTVYAVELDRDFFPYIQSRAKEAGVSNVRTVLGEATDPKLPAADVDVAFFHDVLHHIEDRPAYLKSLLQYLEPTARVAVIDYHPTVSPHRDDPRLQVTKEQATAWFAALGFEPMQEIALFPEKWFVVYGR